jgi:hypothetical protein
MAILNNITINTTGTVGLVPNIIYINTNDSDSIIEEPGYLNEYVSTFGDPGFANGQIALVQSVEGPSFWDVVVSRLGSQKIYSLVLNTDGCVTAVTGVSPIQSSGGFRPAISLASKGIGSGTATNATVTYDDKGLITAISSGTSSNLPFSVITTNTTMVANRGYIINSVSRIDLTLPSIFSVGDLIYIIAVANSPWRILQNAGQSITYQNLTSTVGVSGYIDSLGPDGLTNSSSFSLVGRQVNSQFAALNPPSQTINIV